MPSLRLLFYAATFLISLTTLSAEKPFDFATTPGKLPKQVVPEEYAIRITPDLGKFTFAGSETIKLNVRQPVRQLVLNALEIKITSASVDGKTIPPSAIKLDPKEELLTITLASELPAGPHSLELKFTGKINQQGQGLYYAPYQEQGTGAKKIMLGSQFEATDARRFFPCWDEPSFRARFQLTAVVPENFIAVSNMPVEKETKIASGKEFRFAATPPMPSYLNVLCAGELETLSARWKNVDHGVVTTMGKAVMGRYALDSSQQILTYFNDYFGVPYSLPKIDHIAVPGGFGGAMENWGGITYYESRLLFDPEKSSAETKQNIYEVIAHEVAHMWFGDLVTMAWWDNLWLNEGFASWMGTKCTAKFNPDWEVWLRKNVPRDPARRYGLGKESAMDGDARSTTHPIQQPVGNEAEAGSAFDDIAYRKGLSFITMLESFLGEEVFRDGIRKYMAAHKLSNTTTADLWNSLSEASGKPVGDIAAAWTEQPGFPVVKVARGPEGEITLTQERFTVHYEKAPPLEWKIPLTYSVAGEAAPSSLLMTSKTIDLPGTAAGRAVKLNAGGAGTYRVQYDDESWKLLLGELPKLSSADRANLLLDAWALVQANRAPLSHYLELVEKLPTKDELAEREQVMHVFDFINRLLVGTPQREPFQKYARSILRPSFEQLGWEPRRGEPPKTVMLRGSLINALGDLNDEEIVAGCRDRFQKYLSDPRSLAPDLRPPVFAVVGRYADEATWNKLHELGLKTTSIEEKQNYYDALACALDPKLAARTLEISLGEELPTSRAIYLVAKVARQSEHPEVAWQFARANMKKLLAKTDALTVNSYAPGLFTFFSDSARIPELERYAKSDLPPTAAKSVAKAIDEVGFRAEFKTRLTTQIGTWLDAIKGR
ncbi:MAG TPA: M1 family metallopeptidase [Chthoniobacterales bacterium]|nr:M1 family metallopeptidase [Chthoniobacterales bacterium]